MNLVFIITPWLLQWILFIYITFTVGKIITMDIINFYHLICRNIRKHRLFCFLSYTSYILTTRNYNDFHTSRSQQKINVQFVASTLGRKITANILPDAITLFTFVDPISSSTILFNVMSKIFYNTTVIYIFITSSNFIAFNTSSKFNTIIIPIIIELQWIITETRDIKRTYAKFTRADWASSRPCEVVVDKLTQWPTNVREFLGCGISTWT